MAAQTIKSISLHQPYASYIMLGAKRHETRSWQTPYRGVIAMHAAKKWDDETIANNEGINRKFPAIPLIQNPPLGAMLGICRLLNCERTEAIRDSISAHEKAVGGWADGRYAWQMEVLEVFDIPIPAKGQQGLFEWELPADWLEKRIAIVGSRDYADIEAVKRYVYSLPSDVTIVSGGARGVDTIAVDTAKERGMKTVVIPVNQRGLPDDHHRNAAFGQRAMQRNGEIVSLVGTVTAFWDEKSSGTANTIERAEKAGKTVMINPTVARKPTQMKMSLNLGTYDEGAYIASLQNVNHFSPVDEKGRLAEFEFEWPWLATKNDVWVKGKEGAFRLVPIESDEAKSWGNILRGWMYQSETLALREWLKANADSFENFISIPAPFVELNVYALDDALHAVKPSDVKIIRLPVEKLTFTQAHYNPGICLKYLEAGTVKEFESGTFGMVYRFGDDERYYLTNGSHRALAWLMGLDPKRRAEMPLRYVHIPQSLEALQERAIELDDDSAKLELIADILHEALAIVRSNKIEEYELVSISG